MNPIYRKSFEITDEHADCFGRLKLSALLYFAQEISGHHTVLLGCDREKLAQKDLFWAVTRHRVQITRLPEIGQTVTVETWPMPTTRVAYPRATVCYDAQGNELFRTVTLWVLMDKNTRAMVLPGKSGVPVEGTLRGTELALPHSIIPRVLQNRVLRTVGYSLLDRNGHMNNTRCMEWTDDLLPSSFHSVHPALEFTVCYLSEAREGERLELSWELSQARVLTVEAHRESVEAGSGQERVFAVQVQY